LFVNISLRWSAWDANTEVNSATVIIHPNGKSSQNEPEMSPFEISIPTNVLNSKPNEWSTLSIVFETTLANGTSFGIQASTSLTLAERDEVIIQSDKAKYKPGNLVNFRFLLMNINLKPTEFNSLSYVIESPSGNKMSQKKATLESSVYENKFQLDQYCEQGQWKIKVKAENTETTLNKEYTFEVEEYVLPKFEVEIGLNKNFLVLGEKEDIPIKIDATYTFGKPVSGEANVVITKMPCGQRNYYRPTSIRVPEKCKPLDLNCVKYDKFGCRVPPELKINVKKYNGRFTTTLDREQIEEVANFEDDQWHCKCGNNLKISATVIDQFSDEELFAEAKLAVHREKYVVNEIYSPSAPREGIPFEFIFKVEYVDGSTIDVGGTTSCRFSVYDGPDEEEVTAELDQDQGGYFKCLVPASFHDEDNLNIKAQFSDGERTGERTKYWYRSRQQTKEFLELTTEINDRKLIPGEHVKLTIKSNYESKVTVVAIAKSEVLLQETVSPSQDNPAAIDFEIDHDMIPEVRFLAFENRGDAWTADSLSFFVEENFEHQVTLIPSKDKTEVGDVVDINIAADTEADVYLLGVDKSVLLLASGNDVTQQKLLEVTQKPSEDSWRPWNIWRGCGWWFPWSYGNDAVSKIQDAGYGIVNVKSIEVSGF
jgi:CD109 antigen